MIAACLIRVTDTCTWIGEDGLTQLTTELSRIVRLTHAQSAATLESGFSHYWIWRIIERDLMAMAILVQCWVHVCKIPPMINNEKEHIIAL